MRLAVLKAFIFAALALPLAACNATTGMLAANEPAHISRIKVSLAPNVASQRFADLVQARTTQHAARFGRAGAAKELRIVVERYSYKNPALSLLAADANYVGGRVAVIDVASGRVQDEVEASWADQAGVNGVVGAIVAAAQDEQKVDERLADGLAKIALRLALGSAIVDPVLFRDDPIIYTPPVKRVPQAPSEKANPTAKSSPAAVPAKRDKIAMAVSAAPVVR